MTAIVGLSNLDDSPPTAAESEIAQYARRYTPTAASVLCNNCGLGRHGHDVLGQCATTVQARESGGVRVVKIAAAVHDRAALHCAQHGMSVSGVIEALLEGLPGPDSSALAELERCGRVERGVVNDDGEQAWTVKPFLPTEDPVLSVMRRLIRIIERDGGYLRSEDQRAMHDAREISVAARRESKIK